MKNILLTLMVFGIVGCSQQESNTWICDSKTFTQDEKQSWADRVTLMRLCLILTVILLPLCWFHIPDCQTMYP